MRSSSASGLLPLEEGMDVSQRVFVAEPPILRVQSHSRLVTGWWRTSVLNQDSLGQAMMCQGSSGRVAPQMHTSGRRSRGQGGRPSRRRKAWMDWLSPSWGELACPSLALAEVGCGGSGGVLAPAFLQAGVVGPGKGALELLRMVPSVS